MSRKVTKQACSAFISGNPIRISNTKVTNHNGIVIMYLHGNEIARRNWNGNDELEISNAGWFSNTTKERLNGLPNVSIQQIKGKWYLNGREWNGKMTLVATT